MAQYIYILINPSLTGLLKIGKTNRSPEQRAIELSNGTNMPTPFVVAYEEEVPDSHVAEKLVHEELTRQGFRISDNREFFSTPLKAAILVVSQVAQQLRESADSNSGESLDDTWKEEESTAEYYLLQGLEAMNGSEYTLQDYGTAREFFERAISLGSAEAHIFLAYLYLGGNGVRQSHETALKILKAGGDKGESECFKIMWEIYSGRLIPEIRHEGNAELCFQWYLDASRGGLDCKGLEDYLLHSYEMLGGEVSTWGKRRFPISQFPGKFVSEAIDRWIEQIQQIFLQLREERLLDETLSDRVEPTSPPNSPASNLIWLHFFLSNCVQDRNIIMKRAMLGIEKDDLEYFFHRKEQTKASINEYIPYISAISTSTTQSTATLQEMGTSVTDKKPRGFFSRLFSRG